MLRLLQFFVFIVTCASLVVLVAIPITVVSGIAQADEPVSAIVGSMILAIPFALGATALGGILWRKNLVQRQKTLYAAVVFNAILAVALVYLAAKAWRQDLHSFIPLLLVAAAIATGISAVILPPLRAVEGA